MHDVYSGCMLATENGVIYIRLRLWSIGDTDLKPYFDILQRTSL
jgi:hypothetical protein